MVGTASAHPAKQDKFHSKAVNHWRRRVNSDDLTSNLDADYISRAWSIYANIHEITREPKVYESTPSQELEGCRVDGEHFLWGIPRDDLLRGLMWHPVYKPFWNEGVRHSPLAPSWSWASLGRRVGWPDYSGGRVEWDVVHVEDIAVEELQADGEGMVTSRDSTRAKSAPLSLTGEVFTATFELHIGTERKGSLTGPALEKTLACTMDCDFRKQDVVVLKILTGRLEGGPFCTRFLVFEAILPGQNQNVFMGRNHNVASGLVQDSCELGEVRGVT